MRSRTVPATCRMPLISADGRNVITSEKTPEPMNGTGRFAAGFLASMAIIVAAVALLIMEIIGFWVFIALFLISFAVILIPIVGGRTISAEIADGKLHVKAMFVDARIPLSRIDAVELRQTFDPGIRLFGYGGMTKGYGDFSNEEFGGYVFAGDTKVPSFIVVRYDGRKTLVFNLGDSESTYRMYSSLVSVTDAATSIPVATADTAEKHRRSHLSNKRLIYGLVAVTVVIAAAIIAFALISGHADAYLEDDGIRIDASMYGETIPYDSIASVSLESGMDYGTRVMGYSSHGILSGDFRNDAFGGYKLAVHKGVSECIVVHKADGDVTVFNLGSSQETREFYDALCMRLSIAAP